MGIFNFMKYITNCDTPIRVNHKNMEIELGKPFQWDRMGIKLTEPMVGRWLLPLYGDILVVTVQLYNQPEQHWNLFGSTNKHIV